MGVTNSNIINTTWSLLKCLLEKHEKDKSTDLHKSISRKLLQDGAFLPEWLLMSYKVFINN